MQKIINNMQQERRVVLNKNDYGYYAGLINEFNNDGVVVELFRKLSRISDSTQVNIYIDINDYSVKEKDWEMEQFKTIFVNNYNLMFYLLLYIHNPKASVETISAMIKLRGGKNKKTYKNKVATSEIFEYLKKYISNLFATKIKYVFFLYKNNPFICALKGRK